MTNTVKKDVSFSLYSFQCNAEDCSCDVVLVTRECKNPSRIRYIDFVFPSSDAMILYLRILARSVQSHSIQNLMHKSFPAKISYEIKFNTPERIREFCLANDVVWPLSREPIHRYFIFDEPE